MAIDFTDIVQVMLSEKAATGGFNYEKEVNDRLKKMGVAHKDSGTAGSSADAPDAKFHHNGQEHNLEIKQNSKAMFGQIELKHDGEKWDLSDRSKKKYPHTAKAIQDSGFLHKVNKQWGKPSGDYDKDLQLGNVYHTHHDAEPIKAHYGKDRKTDYIQIGGGHGFYHTGNDAAGLGSPELEGKATLRARMKYRGTDKKTGKKKYGALVVMGLKDAEKSHHNLDNPIQKEWINDVMNGHQLSESAFNTGFYAGETAAPLNVPYEKGTEEYNQFVDGYYRGNSSRLVRQTNESHAPVAPSIGVHRIGVTVSDPDDTMVTKRDETKQKFVRVTHHDKDKAIEVGKKHFAKKGWKVHDAWHAGNVHESLEEAKIGDKVEIIGGSAKGTRGTVGEIRHGLYKGAPKTYTVYHGEKDATQVKQHLVKRIKEDLDESHVEFRIDHRDKLTGDHKSTFAAHDAKVSDTTDKATYVKVPSHKADSFKSAMKRHGAKVELAEAVNKLSSKVTTHTHAHVLKKIKSGEWEAMNDVKPGKHVEVRNTSTGQRKMVNVLAESDAAWAATKEKEKEKRLTPNDQDSLAKLRALMAKEKKPMKESSGAYEKSEENKRSADAAKKQGDMFAHHLHMADYHDNLAQWHSEKGRHSVADSHVKKSEEHQEKAMGFKEEVAANNVGSGAIAGTQGDAGKKVVMTKEPLKRKPLAKFTKFVAQDHENT